MASVKRSDPRKRRLHEAITIGEQFRDVALALQPGALTLVHIAELSEKLENIKRGGGHKTQHVVASPRPAGRPQKWSMELYAMLLNIHADGERMLKKRGIARPGIHESIEACTVEMARAEGEPIATARAAATRLSRRYSEALRALQKPVRKSHP